MASSVLFIGGTGQISLPCVELAVAAGHKVTVFNRGQRDVALPTGVEVITGDMKDASTYATLGDRKFDVVAQFMVFTPDQMAQDIATFSGKTGQYIFISSASVYEKPARHYIITEKTPAVNPYWGYSQAKIACEAMMKAAEGLSWTNVRPSHTVRTGLPTMMGEGDVVIRRMQQKKPVIVAGDGTTPWTLTRSKDFAVPFVKLFGNAAALGEDIHITSDRGYSWDDIYRAIGRGIGLEPNIVHVPTDTLIRYNKAWEGPLLGDKTWSALFDNSKIKRIAGDFTCSEDLDEVLEEPISFLKQRLAANAPINMDLDPLMEKITSEQLALGA